MNTAVEHSGKVAKSVLAQAYQPIIRGYFAVAATYYAIMTLTHFWALTGTDLLLLGTAGSVACVSALAAWRSLRRPLSAGKLEVLTSFINLLVLANVIVALEVEYSEAKLVYFVIMAMIFAFASVSMRQAFASIVAALGSLFFMIGSREPDQLVIYGFVAFAAGLSTFSIAFFLRRAIALAVEARQQAEVAQHDAERRLDAAEHLGEAMRQQSLTDSLTGLPNRRAFFHVLGRCMKPAETDPGSWLMLLDLDGFKAVNDHYGHIIGDELLKSVALRLKQYCGPHMHASRMGGDEFNIVLVGDETDEEIENWCQGLLAHLAEVYLIEDRLIQISGSIGCYRITSDETDISIIRKADYALLHAKRNGKNRVIVFKEEHAKDAAERFTIEQALRTADFTAEICLMFQPQHDLSQGKIVCAEALARWNNPVLGAIEPARFIEIAEECGLVSRITVTVLDKALDALRSLGERIPVSINLSGHDLISDQIIDEIIGRVQASGISAALIEFEITETAMMPDVGRASANLHRLARLGHPISLDDFGTGYSNFSYLRSLPIGKLKVDRSFMEDIGDPMTEKILGSLVGIAHTLGVHCLLEGIENELELVVAKRVGAQSVQGYLFGVPMSETELISHILEADGSATTGIGSKSTPRRSEAPARARQARPPREALRLRG